MPKWLDELRGFLSGGNDPALSSDIADKYRGRLGGDYPGFENASHFKHNREEFLERLENMHPDDLSYIHSVTQGIIENKDPDTTLTFSEAVEKVQQAYWKLGKKGPPLDEISVGIEATYMEWDIHSDSGNRRNQPPPKRGWFR